MTYTTADRMYINSRRLSVAGCDSTAFIIGGESAIHIVGQEITVVTVSYPHHELHEGNMFEVSYKSPDATPVADNGTVLLRLATGLIPCHTVFGANFGGDGQLELLEGVTITAPGTGLAENNMNRTSANIATATAFLNPTFNGGTVLFDDFIPGGTGGTAVGGSGTLRPGTEWILNPSTEYILRATNRAGTNQPVSVLFQWYEDADMP